jgi:hypothetical protein
MKKDLAGAFILIGVFVFMTATRTRAPAFLTMMSGSRQLSTFVVLGSVYALYTQGLHMTALVAGLLSVYLLKTFWITWPRSYENEVQLHISQDKARFDPSTSVDLQFANKTLTHNLPVLLVRPLVHDNLLTFPPSSQTLDQLSR